LQQTVAEGNFYEAQQMYKTLYFRYYSTKRILEAKGMLTSGALVMLQHSQTTCATELARLLLNIYNEQHTKVTKESLEPIVNITAAYPIGDQGKISLLKNAIKWSITEGNNKQGDSTLYALLARSYAEVRDYAAAQKCYIKSNEPQEFSVMLVKWISEGYSSESDLFLGRAVFQYLSLSNLRDANILFAETSKHIKGNTPLMNFVRFLLLTLEYNAYPLFEILLQKYLLSLTRDPSFLQYLDHIAQVFYGMKPRSSSTTTGGFGNFFSDMLKSLLSPGSEELESEEAD